MGIFSCLSVGSISTLSFSKCDLFCSSSLRHNRAVFIVCRESGRERAKKRREERKKKGEEGMGQEDKTNEWSGRQNVSVFPPSFISLSVLTSFNCQSHSSALSPLSIPLFFSLSLSFFLTVFFLKISFSFSLFGRNFGPSPPPPSTDSLSLHH